MDDLLREFLTETGESLRLVALLCSSQCLAYWACHLPNVAFEETRT